MIYDRKGIQQDEAAPDMSFEAAWGADGALCVSHTRIPDVLTMEGLAANCPGVRQQPRTACESRAGALILNRSIDRRTVQAATEQSFRGRSAGLIGVRMFQMFKRMH
ncbi:MAG: hypothetical protein E5X58_17035 [Mesorhizobium sp.]|nr:MAG: hypothetical protein E5X58_17035 [Mesorhizobium sp.]